MYTNTRVFEKNFVCLITQFYLVENYIVIFSMLIHIFYNKI